MASLVGRMVQDVIDRVRGKQRHVDPADRFGLGLRDARNLVKPSGERERLFYQHDGRIAHKWHHYLAIYEHHFQQFQQFGITPHILELGISRGGSLQLWRKFFICVRGFALLLLADPRGRLSS